MLQGNKISLQIKLFWFSDEKAQGRERKILLPVLTYAPFPCSQQTRNRLSLMSDYEVPTYIYVEQVTPSGWYSQLLVNFQARWSSIHTFLPPFFCSPFTPSAHSKSTHFSVWGELFRILTKKITRENDTRIREVDRKPRSHLNEDFDVQVCSVIWSQSHLCCSLF